MRQIVRSARRAWSSEKVGLLGLAIGLPLACVGVVSAPRMQLALQNRALERAEELHVQLESLRAWSSTAGNLLPSHYEQLTKELRVLVPSEVDQVDLFADVARAANGVGFELQSVELADPEDVGIDRLDEPVGEVEATVQGTGTRTSAMRLIDALRVLGHPFELTSLSLHRARPQDDQFSIELRLGLFTFLPFVEEIDTTLLPAE